jgi:acetylglutamate kinase
MEELLARTKTLTEALPYIKRWHGRIVVVKLGGAAMAEPGLRESVAQDLVLMRLVGMRPVVVHGGGPEISARMEELGLPVTFEDGLRVTDDAAMEVVKDVLCNRVNASLVDAINSHGDLATGVAGDDAHVIAAEPISSTLGRVGTVASIHTESVTAVLEAGRMPVVASIGYGEDGSSFNINADLVAGELAAALGSEKVIFLTDVDGLYRDFQDKTSLISALSLGEARDKVETGALAAGMIPKVGACVAALAGGVRRAHILNGTIPHALLLEVYTDEGVGTMITHAGNGKVG